MPSGGWRAELLLLLLLLPPATQAQSGDTDTEPRISCTSDIMTDGSSLTCKLVAGQSDMEDDEDDGDDGDDGYDGDDSIERMRACSTDWRTGSIKCMDGVGDTINSTDLNPLLNYSVTVHLKRGRNITTVISMKKIVKPRRPQVQNVTFIQESHRAIIQIRTPYHNDYLKVDNQLFQLHIWSAGSATVQNISSSDSMIIDMEHLQANTEYHVKVRAIPLIYLQGTWSEWSEPFTFFTPAEEEVVQQQTEDRRETFTLIVCLVPLLVVTSTLVFFRKTKIFTYMWPSIPHPKHTLVQICKPNKGLLLNFKPEVFSALKVYPMEKTEEETEPSIAAPADGTQSNHPCSTQSSDSSTSTTSVSTEELELSALLSRSSSDGEDGLQSTSPSPINALQLGEEPDTPQPERSSGGNEAEAYVTMSSFYQTK